MDRRKIRVEQQRRPQRGFGLFNPIGCSQCITEIVLKFRQIGSGCRRRLEILDCLLRRAPIHENCTEPCGRQTIGWIVRKCVPCKFLCLLQHSVAVQ